ncbi:ORF2 [Gorilla anellovirus]|uniref:ORF2 n=1 Tax=Gorilla anellovirus TaxID=1743411 RepID=A0A0S2GN10_9VIRU|nr:ORF2 [Gorilla anellovirus]ALN98246.1 ORF2 [Gorilla anellovirus]
MSDRWIPPKYAWQGRELQWINSIHTTHDTWCGCSSVITHFLRAVSARGEFLPVYTPAEKAISFLPECPTTTEEIPPITATGDTSGIHTEEERGLLDLEEGDSDALFADDHEEDAAG